MGNTTKIDLEKLDTYITELQSLNSEWANKVYAHEDVGENAGYTIIEIENLSVAYNNIQTSFVKLMDKTLAYMKNRKTAFESQDSTATNTIKN